ncbi:glycosyltransferase [Paenibacillus lutrae]|uniref:Glycosyltransferase n=1 Tax=Paenibacillus lutrae TaxID=2078573 RepID=A0A7X3FFT9_9BACL|nr:glycosyltransferase [Paenibacillus lutrae]MVO98874.1 glycosyltransferase [Paenibacillus lutrae]
MAKVYIAVQRVLGHVYPALGIGQQLQKRGHVVTILTHSSNEMLVRRAGLDFLPAQWGKFPEKFVYEQTMEIHAYAAGGSPDLLICDSSQAAPAYAAEMLGMPWISLQTTVPYPDFLLPGSRTVQERMRKVYEAELNHVRQRLGLAPLSDPLRTRGDLAGLSPRLHLVNAVSLLFPGVESLPAQTKFAGNCVPDTGGQREAVPLLEPARGKPVVLVCASSTGRHDSREIMNRYIWAAAWLAGEGAFELIVSEHQPYQGRQPLPANVHWISEYPNHDRLMPMADAVLTHGGCGTLQTVMKHGLPMLIVPLASDQELLASRCVELGFARAMGAEEISRQRILTELEALLLPGSPLRYRAKQTAELAELRSPGDVAADEIESFLTNTV